MAQLTPKQAANTLSKYPRPAIQEIDGFVLTATTKELQEFIHLIDCTENAHWFDRASIALNIRLAEDAAKTAEKLSQQTDKLIQHSEQLTKQTDIHIQHSEKLTRQTDKLVNETVKLTWLTIALGIFAVVQIVIMVFDYLKHK